ncbi:MAG: HetP family heterocyst commitment protein [Phormidesmis sp.]
MYSNQPDQSNTTIGEDKMEGIVDAILEGKYSYACLIMLEAAGYDPMQYIPYRTYNRLQKQHQANYRSVCGSVSKVSLIRSKISDLEYVENLGKDDNSVGGGHGYFHGEYSINNIVFWPG